MDLTLFLFNSRQQVRAVITQGIAQCIHGERSHTLTAEIPTKHKTRPGEYLGFRCVDGRFRMFCIDYADEDDTTAMTAITATDAAVDELAGTVINRADAEKIGAGDAVREILAQTGFKIGKDESGDKTAAAKAGMMDAWSALKDVERAYDLHIEAAYTFEAGRITGKTVDILAKKKVYRGRLVEQENDASGIVITYGERPRPMVYGYGADGLTIEGVVWRAENGDPTDKPAGQKWIAVPGAPDEYPNRGQVYELPDVTDANELTRKCWEKAQEAAKPSVTATARISDMEMIAGQSWKAVRLFDLVVVRPKHGEDATEQVIDIERNYVREADTKITLGKEKASTARQVASLMRTAAATSRSVSSHGRSISSTMTSLEDTQVRLYELDGYTHTELNRVSIELNAQEAAILLKASQEDLSIVERRLSSAEIRIDGAEAEILLKASQAEFKGLEEQVREAFIRIDGAESEIELKADKIALNGYVTANQLSAEMASIRKFFTGESTIGIAAINTLRASYANAAYLYVNGTEASWKSFKAVTGGSINVSHATVTVTEGMTLRIPASITFSPNTNWLYYLGR